jgi:hypothetical protein
MNTTEAQADAGLQKAGRPWARQRDRRGGITALLASLSQGLREDHAAAALRERFESALRQIVPLRSVHLRETGPPFTLRPPGPSASTESVCLDIPMSGPTGRALLEATFDRATGLDEWDFQTLNAAVHVASFVLEIERAAAGANGNGMGSRTCRADGAAPLIGSSPAMHALRERIERLSLTDFTVLIEGESGTGKELVARQIHDLGRRSKGPFVAINCAALVETLVEAELFGIEERTATGVKGRRGKFEHAQGGTLFLDEVSDLSVAAQAKLLRAIQDLAVERVGGHGSRHVDIRILVAPGRSLANLVDRGLFRQDLFYRLSGVELRAGPSHAARGHARTGRCFVARYRNVRPLEFSPAAHDVLRLYDWPGNVRELERLVEGWSRWRGATGSRLMISRRRCGEVCRGAAAFDREGESLRAFGSPLRPARARAVQPEQAAGLPGARHQLPHPSCVNRVRAVGWASREPAGIGGGRRPSTILASRRARARRARDEVRESRRPAMP